MVNAPVSCVRWQLRASSIVHAGVSRGERTCTYNRNTQQEAVSWNGRECLPREPEQYLCEDTHARLSG